MTKTTKDETAELVGAEALGDEARASVAEAIEQERKDDQPRRSAGMPAETDFVTPRRNRR